MTLGAWRSYKELEDSLSLPELINLSNQILDDKVERLKDMARAMGTYKGDENKTKKDPMANVKKMVDEKRGEQKKANQIGGIEIQTI